MFSCNEINNSGFIIKFNNHFKISVQFGAGTYSDNFSQTGKSLSSKTAEVTITSPNGSYVNLYENEIMKNVTPEQLVIIMNQVSQLTDFYPNI